MPISEAFLIDCMEYMKGVPDRFFDLAIVDTPYGINAPNMQMGSNPNRNEPGQYPGTTTAVKLKGRLNSGSGKLKNRFLNKSEINWDCEKPTKEYFDQLFRVSKNQIIWGGNYFPLPPTRGIAVWNKMQPWDNFSQCELAWTSFDVPAKLKSLSNTGGNNLEIKIHPTQKPVKLYQWLLGNYAKAGDKIFDSHMGSQSSRIAAHQKGFDYWGCEIDPTYYEDGCNRFKLVTSQLQMAI